MSQTKSEVAEDNKSQSATDSSAKSKPEDSSNKNIKNKKSQFIGVPVTPPTVPSKIMEAESKGKLRP